MEVLTFMVVFVGLMNIFLVSCYTIKACSRTERGLFDGNVRYYVKQYCCDNHEPTGNYCKECTVGFTSVNGDKCMACQVGTYGRRCTELCDCSKGQRNRGRQNITNSTAQINLRPFEQENSEQFVNHDYEEIDDQISMPLELIVNRTRIWTHEASSRYIDVIGFTSDYLNPYQPIIAYSDSHNYTTCGLTSCKKKFRNSLPASIECLKNKHVQCEFLQRMKDTEKISSTLPFGQCHQMKDFPKNKINHICNFKKKRRWSL
ncbi:unnamed protein product [Mytilus coruscus]|uniref:MEGF10_11 n=1 Tax=Mytilus coruscus TaxID=42192 RepID=A0A6J8CI86_MYTCO|nr:unnamed protein product [Mytilus coruscus]